MRLFQHNVDRGFVSHLASIALLCALSSVGCKQSTPAAAPASPWSTTTTTPPAGSTTQRQLNMLSDLWRRQNEQLQASTTEMQRRQLEQLNELHRQAEEQARLAEEQRVRELQRQSELSQARQEDQKEVEQLRRRAMQLDTDNRDLHAQLAKSAQENRLLEDQVKLLNKRLGETANQLAATQQARNDSERAVQALQASTRRRGSATITANSSVANTLTAISIPGIQVRQDGDVVRMELPSDQIFMPQSATINPSALPLLDRVAQAIADHYPRQIIGVEGHTDSDPLTGTAWRSSHQLTAAQALAVLDQLAKNQALSYHQLSQAGHGPNYPVASNATPAGKARNRRVEIVVYPETLDQG